VVALRSYVGGSWRGKPTLDLGTVPPAEATDYLLGVAERGEGKPASDAIFPASIAEGAVVWPRLLTLAKDEDRPRKVRESAIFWVSQAAGDEATRGLQEVVDDPAGDREVRKSAVFSLSQRPADEAVPALLRIARTHKDPEIRRSAIFWLGQSKDPRAVGYFEEVLLRKK
jgi:HEAT repeat protein